MDPTVTIRLNNRNINDVIKFMYERYSWKKWNAHVRRDAP
jgi:hypothetical protein